MVPKGSRGYLSFLTDSTMGVVLLSNLLKQDNWINALGRECLQCEVSKATVCGYQSLRRPHSDQENCHNEEVEWTAQLGARAKVHPTPLSKDFVPRFPGPFTSPWSVLKETITPLAVIHELIMDSQEG